MVKEIEIIFNNIPELITEDNLSKVIDKVEEQIRSAVNKGGIL